MKNVYSVGQVNSYIKNMFTQDYALNRIYVKGEVSNCKYHTSGHIYFSLKDETGTLSCVMFAGQRKGLAFRMENGNRVVVLGGVNVYERDGKYQLYAREIILDGAGLLHQRFEQLKKALEEMGMFSQEYKQPIPPYCKRIGIVTASTGAAVQDIMNISRRRNPFIQLILYPALVQGEGAAESVCKGIQILDKAGVDVIIAGRGGGSIEDLWAFNEEIVARAIFECSTPVISAVGHETDVTIADYVADLRAPTPSAAAELAVFEYGQFASDLLGRKQYMHQIVDQKIAACREKLQQKSLRINYLSPVNKIREQRQYVSDLEDQFRAVMQEKLISKKHSLQIYIEKLEGLSPLKKLKQGYSFVSKEDSKAVTSTAQVKKGEKLKIHVTDGAIEAEVTSILKV